MSESFIESSWTAPDESFENPLRPESLQNFLGQESVRQRLEIFIGAAKKRSEPIGHCLFYGPPGLGKTTLAGILAKEMQTNLISTIGPSIEKPSDLAGILTNLKPGDMLFIDEIHRLNRSVEEYLYPAMEDFALDLVIDSGPAARSVQVKLNQFTLIGATTRAGMISNPMRSRFAFTCRLDYYSPEILGQIVLRSAKILKIAIDETASIEIACRSRGTPRIANHLLRWVRDFAQVQGYHLIDLSTVRNALEMLEIDQKGLDEMDKKILTLIIDHYNGGPVGLNTLAIAIGEEPMTLAEVYEPFLILKGFIKRTPRGREATNLAYQHLGRTLPKDNV